MRLASIPRRAGIDRAEKGQSMVEFALLAPILFLMFFGLIDTSRAVFNYDVISNGAREGAREAILQYNQCSNAAPGGSGSGITCATPPQPQTSLVGVTQAIRRATGGITAVTVLDSGNTDTGTAPACPAGPTGLVPDANKACAWVFEVGTGTACKAPGGIVAGGPGPSDNYSLCSFRTTKASAASSGINRDVVVEVEYRFQPFTPLVKGYIGNGGLFWAKSEMRAEY
jgi:Flp pilus assembly protein TadG